MALVVASGSSPPALLSDVGNGSSSMATVMAAALDVLRSLQRAATGYDG